MKDQLRFVPDSAKNIVINMADSGRPGTHWVALHQNGAYTYFDSFGQPALPEVLKWVNNANKYKKKKKPLYHSNLQYQSLASGYCGEYCLLFIYCQENGIDISTILKPIRRFNY